MAIHRVVNTVKIGVIVYYIDTYYIQYIRRYNKNSNEKSIGLIPPLVLSESIDIVEIHLISGDVLEFNMDTTGISDLIDDFYSVNEYKI